MPTPKTAVILALTLAVLMLVGCGNGTGNANTANTNTSAANNNDTASAGVRDNVDELVGLVKLPIGPEEATWKETTADNTKKLVAVLRFTPENSKKMVEQASKSKPGETVSISTETWFPPELVAQSDMNPDDNITATAYPASDLAQPPYTEGRIARVENTDFFILEMTGK